MMIKRICSILLLASILLLCCACSEPLAVNTNTVEVTFVLKNGDADIVLNVPEGSVITNAPVPEKRACKFTGWYHGDNIDWDLEKDVVTKPITLRAKWELLPEAAQRDPNAGVKAEGTDLRVCTFNALKAQATNATPVADRIGYMMDMLADYDMDIIAFQEFCGSWKEAFRLNAGDLNYKLISHSMSDTASAFHEIAYRSDKLTLVDSGKHTYELIGNYVNDFVWALFETKDDAKQRFIVTSHSWSWNNLEHRIAQSELMAEWVNEQKALHNVPILSLGDYNDLERSKPCVSFLKETGMLDAKYTAAERGLVGRSYHDVPEVGSFPESNVNIELCIDQIFYTDELSALYYDMIVDDDALMISDHNAVYADLKFN